jgi:hypothetical protein
MRASASTSALVASSSILPQPIASASVSAASMLPPAPIPPPSPPSSPAPVSFH